MKLTGTFDLNAAVNTARRTIIGQIVPYGELGNPGLNGQGVQLEVHAGGLTWDTDALPRLRSTHHAEPIGRAVTLDESQTGVVASFKVADTQAGSDALTLAAEGLQAGLSIEADVPDGLTASSDGVYRLTADNPARLTAVALVETPAFASAQVTSVAAKEHTMSEKITAAEVPDEDLSSAISALTEVVTTLSTSLGTPAEEAPAEAPAEAAAEKLPGRRVTAATAVSREPFPYGHPGAEGTSLFRDLMYAQRGDSEAARRSEKATAMMNAARVNVQGKRLTAANEPVVKSTLIIPNAYDIERYVEELVSPRVIADNTPGVQISSPNPIIIPAFSSSYADGGSGEPVIANASEGVNPAQAELATTSVTVTPALYTGLYDVSREAVDGGAPGTDALVMRTLVNSYNESTEAAAMTALLAGCHRRHQLGHRRIQRR